MDKNFKKCENINELHAFTSIIVLTAIYSLNITTCSYMQITKIRVLFSLERKYQKPYDYIDKGPKQEMRIKEIHICFPENKELEARNKQQVVFPLQEMYRSAMETTGFQTQQRRLL